MPDFFTEDFFVADEILSQENTEKCWLSIQLFAEGLAFSILDPSANMLLAIAHHPFKPGYKKSYTEQITSCLQQNPWLSRTYEKVGIIAETQKSTLIPEPLYMEEKKLSYLTFNHDVLADEVVMADKLLNLQAYNIFALPNDLLHSLKELFPYSGIHHFSSSLIEILLMKFKNLDTEDTVFTYVRHSYFDVVYLKNQQLFFSNSFKYNTKEDLIYYLIFVFEQLKMNPEKVQLKIMGEISKEDAVFEMLFRYIRHIEFIDRNEDFFYSHVFDSLPKHSYYNLLNFQLCEL
jgi:hypothetical protein